MTGGDDIGATPDAGAATPTPPPCHGGPLPDAAATEPAPHWLASFDAATAATLDVRSILAEGHEPVAEVLALAARMPERGGLVIAAPFNPAPLREVLHGRGFSTHGQRIGAGLWTIRVARTAAPPVAPHQPAPAPPVARTGSALKLAGAVQRLLPEQIPLRFFGLALIAQIGVWVWILAEAEALPGFRGGAGPVLAALHLLTLGMLLATAMGASFQMLPVIFALPTPPALVCNLAFGLLVAGAAGLIAGFALAEPAAMIGGGALLAGAVALHAATLAWMIFRAGDNRLLCWHLGAAVGAIIGAAALGVALALDLDYDWLNDHQGVALAHLILAGFGFMALLVLGLSQVLVPMFAVAEPAAPRLAAAALVLAVTALLLAVSGALSERQGLLVAGAAAGLGAALCHVAQVTLTVKGRMRRRLGGEFVLIRASWLICPAALAAALLLALGVAPDTMPVLFGFLLLFGWQLTLLLGVLQRILPFLASMHAARRGAPPLAPGKLVAEAPLAVHRWCHLAALALVTGGLVTAEPLAIRLGGAAGSAAAVAFIVYALSVRARTRTHLAAARPAAATRPTRGRPR